MRAHRKLVAEKLRHALRLVTEAQLLGAALETPEPFDARLQQLGQAVAELAVVAAEAAGPEYQSQVLEYTRARGGLRLGDVIGRVLQLDVEDIEALAVDPQFLYRDIAQRVIELRGQIDGRVEVRKPFELPAGAQPTGGLRMARGGA